MVLYLALCLLSLLFVLRCLRVNAVIDAFLKMQSKSAAFQLLLQKNFFLFRVLYELGFKSHFICERKPERRRHKKGSALFELLVSLS